MAVIYYIQGRLASYEEIKIPTVGKDEMNKELTRQILF